MADSKKEEGREDDDHPFDYTDSKKEEAGHDDEEEAGHDDDDDPLDYADSKKEKGHDDDDRPFDYNFQVLGQVAKDFLRKGYPEGYAGAGEERSPPLQRPQDCSLGVAKKKPRSFPEKRSKNKKRVSPPASPLITASTSDVDKLVKSSSSSRGKSKLQESASTSTSTTDSADDPCWNTQLLRRWVVSKSRSRRINFNSGEGTSTDRRLQRHLAAAAADRSVGHQPPPPPAAPQAGRTWREVHREMGGSEVMRIGKKTVHKSDKSMHQSRLLLPQGLETKVYEHVSKKEREKINDSGLQVEVLDYYGQRFEMTCKYRACQKGMVFNSGWTNFLRRHAEGGHLEEGKSLLLLAFRSQQQRLCFVFVPQHLEAEDQQQPADDQDQVIQH